MKDRRLIGILFNKLPEWTIVHHLKPNIMRKRLIDYLAQTLLKHLTILDFGLAVFSILYY